MEKRGGFLDKRLEFVCFCGGEIFLKTFYFNEEDDVVENKKCKILLIRGV